MTVLIVSSSEDPASTNIKNCLLEKSSWKEQGTFYDAPVFRHGSMRNLVLVTIPDKKIRHEDIDQEVLEQLHIQPKVALFLSRHRSKMGEPTLTVHPIGNYDKAEFGGRPKTLIPAAPRMMTFLLRLVKKHLMQTDLEYKVCYEVTHHGPFLRIPTVFVEVGSSEVQWVQKEPATVIATALLDLLSMYHYEEDCPKDIPVLLGLGGGHYAPRFTDIAFQKNIAFGHMIPSYHIDSGIIDWTMIEQAIQTTPEVKGVYLHKKALKKSQVTFYKQVCHEHGVPVVSSVDLPTLS
jgi:D-aminoacyl-tRNA deacylase